MGGPPPLMTDPLTPASQFGLGPGWVTPLTVGEIYERLRYDPGHISHPFPHVNAETWLKDGPTGKNEKLNNVHIPV